MRHIIVGGTNRSGTTSLFSYLSVHPDIQQSSVKQTNFFLDGDAMWKSKVIPVSYSRNLQSYLSLFSNHNTKYLLEASPDYLYSTGTPERIRGFFDEDPVFVFILREPNSRMKSWFAFGKQIGEVPEQETYSEFVEKCKAGENQHLQSYRAIETGRYNNYLKKYYEYFQGNVIACFFEDLADNPYEAITNILHELNLTNEFYENYNFEVHNNVKVTKNRQAYSLYMKLLRVYHKLPKARLGQTNMLTILKKRIKNFIFEKKVDSVNIETEFVDFSDSNKKLESLIGKQVPWNK